MAKAAALLWAAMLRCATGRRARRLYVVLILLVVAFSAVLRVRSFLLTRRIYSVVSQLQQLRVDGSPEGAVLLVPDMHPETEQRTPSGIVATYGVRLWNMEDRDGIPGYNSLAWPIDPYDQEPRTSKWQSLSLPLWVAYVLGWRHVSFEAHVTVLNGVVSSVDYAIEPDVLLGFPAEYMVAVRSVHALWGDLPAPIGDIDDEAPEYRFGGTAGLLTSQLGAGGSLGLAYTTAAPQDLVSRAFEVDLRCFWGLVGCGSAREVLPRLWEDREGVIRAAASRLASPNPCPDRILAGRARSLPDLAVELREVTDPSLATATSPVAPAASSRPGYRLKDTIRSSADGTPRFFGWVTPMSYRSGFLWRRDPVATPLKAGDRMLVFLGVDFQSCRAVPATASAEAAVRTAAPAPRRPEDNYFHPGRQ